MVYFLFEEREPSCVVLPTCPRDRLCILMVDQQAAFYVFLVITSFDRVWSSQRDLISSLLESWWTGPPSGLRPYWSFLFKPFSVWLLLLAWQLELCQIATDTSNTSIRSCLCWIRENRLRYMTSRFYDVKTPSCWSLITYLEPSRSWQDNISVPNQGITRILWNKEVHYHE